MADLFQGDAALELGGKSPRKASKQEKDILPALRGYLNKQDNNIFHTWSENWFVLEKDQLFYYKTERDLEHQGVIDLRKIKEIALGAGSSDSWQFSIVTPERTFYLQAVTEKERKFWIYGLKKWMQHFGLLASKPNRRLPDSIGSQSADPLPSGPAKIGRKGRRLASSYVPRPKDDSDLQRTPLVRARTQHESNGHSNGHSANGDTERRNGHADNSPNIIVGSLPSEGPRTHSQLVRAQSSIQINSSASRRGGKLHSKLGIVDDLSIEGRAKAELLSNRKLLQTYADEINTHTKKREEMEGIIEGQAKEIEKLRRAVNSFEERERIREDLMSEQEQQAKEMIASLKVSWAGGGGSPSSPIQMTKSAKRASVSSSPPVNGFPLEMLAQLRQIEENLQLDHNVYKEELRKRDERIAALVKLEQELKKAVDENQSLKKRGMYFEKLLDDKLRSATEESREKDKEIDRLKQLLWTTQTAELKMESETGKLLCKKAIREGVSEENYKEWAEEELKKEAAVQGNGFH